MPSLAATAAQVLRAQAALARLADRRDLETRRQADEDTEAAELAHRRRLAQAEHTSTSRREDDYALQRG